MGTDEQQPDQQQAEVRLERDGYLTVLTIDRPAARNAIGLATMATLRHAIETVRASDARVLAVRGGGDRVFVSGGDLKELSALRTAADAQEMAATMREALDLLAGLDIPVIGVLNGDAYGGGCEVAISCDFRVAADDIRLGFNQVTLDIMPAWGGIERLVATVGRGRAMYLLSTGRILTAAEALALGLVEEVIPRSEFEVGWRRIALGLAASSPIALNTIKAQVGTVAPPCRPELAGPATAGFAATWVSDGHWEAVARLEERRRLARQR
jgi:enoyl-CoA hydratase/carnithine racemase